MTMEFHEDHKKTVDQSIELMRSLMSRFHDRPDYREIIDIIFKIRSLEYNDGYWRALRTLDPSYYKEYLDDLSKDGE